MWLRRGGRHAQNRCMRAILLLGMLILQGAVSAFGLTNVWMLVPGFTVQELPVKLSNVNNLRFSPKGELTALGYDGRIHILRDSDGDGLEDFVAPFWDKDTLRVPVGMAWAKEGLYVSS